MKLMKYWIKGGVDEDGRDLYSLYVEILEEPVWQWKTVAPFHTIHVGRVYDVIQSYMDKGYDVVERMTSDSLDQARFEAETGL